MKTSHFSWKCFSELRAGLGLYSHQRNGYWNHAYLNGIPPYHDYTKPQKFDESEFENWDKSQISWNCITPFFLKKKNRWIRFRTYKGLSIVFIRFNTLFRIQITNFSRKYCLNKLIYHRRKFNLTEIISHFRNIPWQLNCSQSGQQEHIQLTINELSYKKHIIISNEKSLIKLSIN